MILYHSGHLGERKDRDGSITPEMGAVSETAALLLRGRARLLSFADFKLGRLPEELLPTLARLHSAMCLDSGAFSVAQGTTDITPAAYAEFLDRNVRFFDFVTNLDVLGDAEASLRNHEQLAELGHHTMPVFHLGSPYEFLDEMVLGGERYIGLGGMAAMGTKMSARVEWLQECFARIPANVKVHGFGVGPALIKRFLWHSVDCTRWLEAARYGKWPPFHSGVYTLAARCLPWIEYLDSMAHAVGDEYVPLEKLPNAKLFETRKVDRKREKGADLLGPVEVCWPRRVPGLGWVTPRLPVLLLGEAPSSASSDPLEPLSGQSGRRLAALMGMGEDEYLDQVPRDNLFDHYLGPTGGEDGGNAWDAAAAAEAAKEVLSRRCPGVRMVALGRQVGEALGLGDARFFAWSQVGHWIVAVVPHLSGNNMWWDEAANVNEAKEFFAGLAAGVGLPATPELKQEPAEARKAPPVDPGARAAMQARMRAVLDSHRERAKEPEEALVLGGGTDTIGRCTCSPIRGRNDACPVHGGMR